MKKAAILFLILVLGTVGQAKVIEPVNPMSRGVKASSMGFKNAVFVDPSENLQTKYDWLKSSDRNGEMGTLSATNRRKLICLSGIYTLTTTLTFDTNYVDITSLNGDPNNTIITGAISSVPLIIQTCNDMRQSGITFLQTSNTDEAHTFVINASNNSASNYYRCNFYNSNASGGRLGKECIRGLSNLSGTWWFCNAGNAAWRVATNKNLSAIMYYCNAGSASYGGDQDATISGTGVINGSFYKCIAGEQSFGGCTVYGTNISSTAIFVQCEAASKSYAMGKTFAGKAYDCSGDYSCFAGYSGSGTSYGTFSGYAEGCTVLGGNSFGTGNINCIQSGIIKNCHYGREGRYAQGLSAVQISTVTNNIAQATLTTNLSGSNNDLLYTFREYGTRGNDLQIKYVPSGLAGSVTVGFATINIATKSDGTTTANQVIGYVQGNPAANAMVSVANAPDNDGTGTIPAAGMDYTYLSGGIDPVYFKGNCPWTPIACTSDTTVYPFDNGATYSNATSIVQIDYNLPSAMVGFSYTFIDANNTATVDIAVNPQDTDVIIKNDGTPMAAGEAYLHTTDDYGEMTFECQKAGFWIAKNPAGTAWVEETP